MPTLTKSNQLVPRDERSATIVAPFPGFLLRYERFWRSAKDQARRSLRRCRNRESWLPVKPVAKAKTVQNRSIQGLWKTAIRACRRHTRGLSHGAADVTVRNRAAGQFRAAPAHIKTVTILHDIELIFIYYLA